MDEFPESSDSSDDDYVPSGAEDDKSECSSDDVVDDAGEDSMSKKSGKFSKNRKHRRKAESHGDEEKQDESAPSLSTTSDPARIDSLWAEFKKDTSVAAVNKEVTNSLSQNGTTTSLGSISDSGEKVTILQTRDFAGETITISKEVDANSKEAARYKDTTACKTEDQPDTSGIQDDVNAPAAVPPATSESLPSRCATAVPPKASLPPVKRPGGGLSSIMSMIGKKQKMGVLEKSKLDWESFKKDEKIDEELKTFNRGKEGYLERQDFLTRTDLRQFEEEKQVRAKSRSLANR